MRGRLLVASLLGVLLLASCSADSEVSAPDGSVTSGVPVQVIPIEQEHLVKAVVYNEVSISRPWFTEEGLHYSWAGQDAYLSGYEGAETVPSVPVRLGVVIEESTEGCEPGYKNVTATFDYRHAGENVAFWVSAFDKFTGTSFEFADGALYVPLNSPVTICNDRINIVINGVVRDISMTRYSRLERQGRYSDTVVVNCPETHNGVVFQFAPISADDIATIADMNWMQPHTIAELPMFSKEELFYSTSAVYHELTDEEYEALYCQ